jgi:hypothetical protein
MLHVRVVSPAIVTGQLAGTLATAAGVQNVVVQAGGAHRPDGDAVQFDVRDEAANPVLAALRDLGLDRDGVICVERVDAVLTGQPPVAADRGALRRETAPVWEMVEAIIRGGQAYAPSFYVLRAVAGLIGAVGLITNSQVLIVAAMVVGPEYNAIIAVALGISSRHRGAVRDGLLALCGASWDPRCSCCSTSSCSSWSVPAASPRSAGSGTGTHPGRQARNGQRPCTVP